MEIDNITENIREKKILKLIADTSEDFLQSAGNNLNYQKFTDDILYISGAKYAAFNLYDEDGNSFTTVAISAPQGIIKKASSLIGFGLLGKKWGHKPVIAAKTKPKTVTRFLTLAELAKDMIPKPLIPLFEKIFNIGEMIFVKIQKGEIILGDFSIVIAKNKEFKNENYIEIYTRQVGLLITRNRSEAKLIEERMELRSIFSSTNDPLFVFDQKTGQILDVNDSACSIYGYSREEMLKLSTSDMSAEPEITRNSMKNLESFVPIRRHKKRDGTIFTVEISASNFELKGRNIITASMRDITERLRAEKALQDSEKRYRTILKMATSGFWMVDTQGLITEVNEAYCKMSGYSEYELLGMHVSDLEASKAKDDTAARIQKIITEEVDTFESRHRRKDGSIYDVRVSAQYKTDEGGRLVGFLEDITERKKTEAEILHLSFHDHLTGLYNRRFFEEEIKRLDTIRQLPISFIMADLNGLKIINDAFGHNEGDKLINGAAKILKETCRSDDILARWGGDEFVIILPKTSIETAEEIMQRIKKECVKISFQKTLLSLAIGVATKTEAAQKVQSIIICAESNMYKNKLIEKESSGSSILSALEQALYEKSTETKEHTDRIKVLAVKLGRAAKLSSHQLDELSLLATLHDIGKVAIPESILLKKGRLTEKEWEVIKKHPEIGFNIASASPQIAHISQAILCCHENWDGSGYPQGLKVEAISIVSRIIFICDAYDVMTSKRAYKKALKKEDAIKELKRCAGTQFDPDLVEKFIEIISK